MAAFLGCDLGTRRGAVVQLFPDGDPFSKYEILSSWLRGERTKNPIQVLKFLHEKVVPFVGPDVYIGFDWTPYEAYFKKGRKSNQAAITVKALAMGYLYAMCLAREATPLLVAPKDVRERLGMKSNASKDSVHNKFFQQVEPTHAVSLAKMNEHEIDSAIIAEFTWRRKGNRNGRR